MPHRAAAADRWAPRAGRPQRPRASAGRAPADGCGRGSDVARWIGPWAAGAILASERSVRRRPGGRHRDSVRVARRPAGQRGPARGPSGRSARRAGSSVPPGGPHRAGGIRRLEGRRVDRTRATRVGPTGRRGWRHAVRARRRRTDGPRPCGSGHGADVRDDDGSSTHHAGSAELGGGSRRRSVAAGWWASCSSLGRRRGRDRRWRFPG